MQKIYALSLKKNFFKKSLTGGSAILDATQLPSVATKTVNNKKRFGRLIFGPTSFAL